ncbi:MFS transporter [Spirosoma panaciterrae]|uniref:MFS transporter n=1 Tax=Spirosoma panaciterrae TaxID=496058 RepID=UPI000A0055F7|nr:MFS transporter [Spirosoma panaciterrae]
MRRLYHSSARTDRYQPAVLALGLGHGFSDAAAGYLIGSLSAGRLVAELGAAIMVYNLLAFGGQLPAGIWLDGVRSYRESAVGSLLGMVVALILLVNGWIWPAVVLAGLSSAIYHVAGGAITLASFPEKSRFVGIFSAFGVMGLALGGWCGAMHCTGVTYLLIGGLTTIALMVGKVPVPMTQKALITQDKPQLDTHDYLMILLLTAIALRSAVWNVIQLLYAQQYDWLLYIALAAMVGKLIGGWLTDRIPWKPYALVALAIALPALGWGYRRLFWLMLGTGLLQSLTPVSVVALQRLFPNTPATVSGATFGLAIALGGLVSFIPLGSYFSLYTQLLLLGILSWCLYYSFWSVDHRRSVLNKER